ncbi:MAG: hypothetical protein A2039_05335 [Candidatus Melainabacteria bacterium GWA2_34_9]|nr:MAG: hypothetical protein A2039_05335 [Candidatus Melainabacteria bacterium GWA2_34_9]
MTVLQKGKNNKWQCEFMIDGRRYYKACKGATSEKEAKRYETVLRSDIMRGDLNFVKKKCTIKLSEMIQKYLEYSKTNKASYTHDKTYTGYWLEYFGNKLLSEIKSIDIEGYKSFRLDKKIKPSTVNRELNSLSKMLSIAKQNKFIENNPCSDVKKLKVDNYKIRFLTKEEEKCLFEAIGEHWIKPIVVTALQTGMRKGEILNLTWDCVNFDQKYIDVLQTKSGKPRQIPISKKLKETLKAMPELSEYIFVNEKTLGVQQNINHVFPEFVKTAEIKDFRFHDLRHTAATRMVEKGVDLVVVKDILGHADINITMRYAHPVPEMKLRAIQALNDY